MLEVGEGKVEGTLQGEEKGKVFLGKVVTERTRGWWSQVVKLDVGQAGSRKRVQVGVSVCWQEAIAHRRDLVRRGPEKGGWAKEGPVQRE